MIIAEKLKKIIFKNNQIHFWKKKVVLCSLTVTLINKQQTEYLFKIVVIQNIHECYNSFIDKFQDSSCMTGYIMIFFTKIITMLTVINY